MNLKNKIHYSLFLIRNTRNGGFTLMEVLIYSALLGLFIGAAFVFISSILGSTDTLLEKNELIANQELIEGKMNWLFGGATKVLAPAPASSSSQLRLTGSSTTIYPATIALSNNNLMLSLNGGATTSITSNRVRVLQFLSEHFSNNQSTSTIKLTMTLQSSVFNQLVSTTTLTYVLPQ